MHVTIIASRGPTSPPTAVTTTASVVFKMNVGIAVDLIPDRIALKTKKGERSKPKKPPIMKPMNGNGGLITTAAIVPQIPPSNVDIPIDTNAVSSLFFRV